MRAVTIWNVPQEVHRAIRVRAAQNGYTLQAEMRAGVALIPAGKRWTVLSDSIEHQVLLVFVGRVLSFDAACTRAYVDVVAAAHKAGSGIAAADAIIAAIALESGFSVAIRDVSPFLAAGVNVINPWEDQE